MVCWGDLSNSILRPEILHGTLYMPKEWENEAWCLIFNKTIFLTHPNLHVLLNSSRVSSFFKRVLDSFKHDGFFRNLKLKLIVIK